MEFKHYSDFIYHYPFEEKYMKSSSLIFYRIYDYEIIEFM